jgi:hypothetical protein
MRLRSLPVRVSRSARRLCVRLAAGATLIGILVCGMAACNLHPISASLTRYGYMDVTGTVVIPVRFRSARSFSEGLAAVELDGRWGYLDRTGTMVIAPQFLLAHDFKDGRALAKFAPDNWKYIDRTGAPAVGIDFGSWSIHARDFSEGLAAVFIEDQDRFGCLPSVGQRVRDEYEKSRGYVSPQFCGRWGFLDRVGRFVVEPQFIEAYDFSEGLAAVRVRDPQVPDQKGWRYGYIDRGGRLAIPARFEAAFEFSEGRGRVVLGGRRGFIDRAGDWVAEPRFDDAKDFHEGLAPVQQGERWGYLGADGRLAIPVEFTRAARFAEGLAAAGRSGRLGGYIDRGGAMVIAEQFGVAWPFSDGRARVKVGDGSGILETWGYIDRSGKVVISRMLKQGWPFQEGLALIGNGGPL